MLKQRLGWQIKLILEQVDTLVNVYRSSKQVFRSVRLLCHISFTPLLLISMHFFLSTRLANLTVLASLTGLASSTSLARMTGLTSLIEVRPCAAIFRIPSGPIILLIKRLRWRVLLNFIFLVNKWFVSLDFFIWFILWWDLSQLCSIIIFKAVVNLSISIFLTLLTLVFFIVKFVFFIERYFKEFWLLSIRTFKSEFLMLLHC